MKRSRWLILALVVSLGGMWRVGHSTTLLHRTLKALAENAERIFVGKCIAVREGELVFDEGKIYYTEYTFQVTHKIKGNLRETFTFRQYGLSRPRQVGENLMLYNRVPGMPVYEEQQEYFLFLNRDSELGLTSPVGLFQGAFRVAVDIYGRKVAMNGLENRGLFRDADATRLAKQPLTEAESQLIRQVSGPMLLNDLISVVQKVMD